jgi:hypothetical protein
MAADLSKLVAKQRAELLAKDEQNLEAIAAAYSAMYDRLQGDIDALILAIEQMDSPTPAQVKALPQYQRLIRRGKEELDKFTAYLETALGTAAASAIALGLQHSAGLINSLISGGFAGLERGVMPQLLKYLAQDGPLYARLKELTGATVDKVVQTILDGVSSGFNPRKIAGMIGDAFGGGLTDALRNTRTVQLYSYRDSARANYMASDGIVTGWVWYAELDADVCMSCVAQHGTFHDLDEVLDDHYNGRCAALPYIPGMTGDIESGQSWFDALSDEEQAGMMGQEKHAHYKAGDFEFDKLSKQVANDVYGMMRTEAPLKDLIGGDE